MNVCIAHPYKKVDCAPVVDEEAKAYSLVLVDSGDMGSIGDTGGTGGIGESYGGRTGGEMFYSVKATLLLHNLE